MYLAAGKEASPNEERQAQYKLGLQAGAHPWPW